MPRVVIAIIVGVLLVAGLFWMLAAQNIDDSTAPETTEAEFQAQSPEQPLHIDIASAEDCAASLANTKSLIQASKSCAVDKDCVLFSPGCPFGCVDAVRRSEIPRIKSAYRDHSKKCGACVYMCPQPANEQQAVCEQSQCVVRDRTTKRLEQDTIDLSDVK